MYTVYSKPDCPFCTSAKTLLEIRGIPYEEKQLGRDLSADEFKSIYPWARTVPQIFDDENNLIGGFSHLKEKFATQSSSRED